MNEFLIGNRLRIHHYGNWTGSAFLAFDEAEFRIPGEAAKIIVDATRAAQSSASALEKRSLICAMCGQPAGHAFVARDDESPVAHALCSPCAEKVAGSST